MDTDVEKARKGDKEAFTRLIKAAELDLYGIAKTILLSDEDCADAIQETILKAYTALPKLKEAKYFRTWLMRILINECNQILRRRKRTVPSAALPEEAVQSHDFGAIDLQDAVDRLDDTLSLVIKLHYFEDMPVSEISELLNTPEGTVKTRLRRARLVLAEWLVSTKERKIDYEPC